MVKGERERERERVSGEVSEKTSELGDGWWRENE